MQSKKPIGTLIPLLALVVFISVCRTAQGQVAIEFRASYGLGSFGYDSGPMGLDEPLVKMQVHVVGILGLNLADIEMRGTASKSAGRIGVNPTPSGGSASFDLGLEYGAYVYYGIPALYLDESIDLLELIGGHSLNLRLNGSEHFTPFLLGESVTIADSLPAQTIIDLDLTNIVFPGLPFVGAGVTLAADVGLQETFFGDRIYFTNPGASIYDEAQTLAFTGAATRLRYYGDMNAAVIVGFSPGIYAEAFGLRFEYPITRISFSVYDATVVLSYTSSDVNFLASAIQITSLTLDPSTVDPYEVFEVRGNAYFDSGAAVTGTATISVQGGNTYTADVSGGVFLRNVQAPGNSGTGNISRTVSVTVRDGDPSTTDGTANRTLTVRGHDNDNYYDFGGIETCEDVDAGNDWWPIYIKPAFSKDDDHIYAWVNLENLYKSVRVRWEWFAPDGRSYADSPYYSEWTDDPQDFGYEYYSWWRLSQGWNLVNPAGGYWGTVGEEGRWEVKVSVKPEGGSYEHVGTVDWVMRYELVEHRMCEGAEGAPDYDPINPKDVFSPSDTQALTWAKFVDVSDPLELKWVFYSPEGQYSEFTDTTEDPGNHSWYGWYKTWGWIGISGNAAAYQCGDWHVDYYIKDAWGNYEKKYTDTFKILEGTAPSIPTISASPASPIETQDITIAASVSDNNHLERIELHWQENGGAVQTESWSSINASSRNVSHNMGSKSAGTIVASWAEAWDESGNHTASEHRSVTVGYETVSTPVRPTGPSFLKGRENGTYSTGGSTTNLGNLVQYLFEWDGSQSLWNGTSQIKSWSTDGHYFVKAQARSQTNTSRQSSWSTILIVSVDSVAPTIQITTNGGDDFVTDQAQIVLEGSCSDSEPASGLASVNINTGDTNEGTLSSWRFTVDLVEGPNDIAVEAVDNAGNMGDASITVTLGCDFPLACGNGACEPDCGEDNTNCPSDCVCGDAIVDAVEQCDDGNTDDCDGCRGDCSAVETGCGDGFVCGAEACDDGNNDDCDGCRGDCSAFETGCGDGFDCGDEACDDGNNADCDGCRADCSAEETGCGDGFRCAPEVCDDGNNADCDGCRADCSSEETGCGDGFLCGVEICDDGNNTDCDGCRADCSAVETGCGDGLVCEPECGENCETCPGDCPCGQNEECVDGECVAACDGPIVTSEPPSGAIDAREPHSVSDANDLSGWSSVEIAMSGRVESCGVGDFSISEIGGGPPVPVVLTVDPVSEFSVRVDLDRPIEPGAWTVITHKSSGSKVCLGFLPADANQNLLSTTGDISALIDSINLVPGRILPDYATDINRSGITNGQDILRLIDLLNGADAFSVWITESLPANPCDP